MKIKVGTVREDVTCFGNRFWIQIEDNSLEDNTDLRNWVGKEVTVVIGSPSAQPLQKEPDSAIK